MNLRKLLPAASGTFLVSSLLLMKSGMAEVPSNRAFDPFSQTSEPVSNFITPDAAVKQLAINTIRQSAIDVQFSSNPEKKQISAIPQSATFKATSSNKKTTDIYPSAVAQNFERGTCPIHVCPPVSPVVFSPVAARPVSPNEPPVKESAAVKTPKSSLPNPDLAPPSTSIEPVVGEPEITKTESTNPDNSILQANVSADTSSEPENFVATLGQHLQHLQQEVFTHSQELMVKINHGWRVDRTPATPNVDEKHLFLPIKNLQSQHLNLDLATNYKFSPRFTLGNDPLLSANPSPKSLSHRIPSQKLLISQNSVEQAPAIAGALPHGSTTTFGLVGVHWLANKSNI